MLMQQAPSKDGDHLHEQRHFMTDGVVNEHFFALNDTHRHTNREPLVGDGLFCRLVDSPGVGTVWNVFGLTRVATRDSIF